MVEPAEFDELVDEALETLPPFVLQRLENLIVVVEEQATPEQDPRDEGLLGLYEGVSLLDRSADYWGALPDQITVFRQPHLALGLSRDELVWEIRTTVLHEIAHFLGIDERRLHELGWD